MSEQTYQVTLPSALAEALASSLERLLKEAGFTESLKAGEVGGVETSVWQRKGAQVVITLRESETEETVKISTQGIDGAELLKAASACLALKLLESLPANIRQNLEPIIAQLREITVCPSS
ncbi:MAG: hypothetical protein N3B10_04910 [Armatimonadetes bacterium]|nr:hypothetical protein [Armatimonadota bacterium]MCX7967816.1 hypothetical protein [Armatimonadota bacterium]MDW8142791.1 hypothetical protein [Armatimonadota bacterium]